MNNDIIIYRSPLEKEYAEIWQELVGDAGAWLWIWVPIILKWYLLVALVVMVIYELITTVKHKRFNGIKDGIFTGLAWPAFVWWAVKPFFSVIFSGKQLKWERW